MTSIKGHIDYGNGKGPQARPAAAPAEAEAAESAAPAPAPRIVATSAERRLVEDRVMACLREAAVAGRRCPTSGEISMWMDDRGYRWHGTGGPTAVTKQLALRGRVRVNVFGKNFRQIEILEPPLMESASKRGAGAPWMVIDQRGVTRT